MIVFLHVPKTAGSSFQFILNNNLGIAHCHSQHAKKERLTQADIDFARKVFPGMKGIAGHNLIDPLSYQIPDPYYMTILRDPVMRVLSAYQEHVARHRAAGREEPDLPEALPKTERLQNLHVKLMSGGLDVDKAKRFLERCDFVGLTEKFDLSLHMLGRSYPGKLDLRYPVRRVAPDNSIKKAWQKDEAVMELVRKYNRLDIELYDFAVKEIFPKLCEKAGLKPSDPAPSYAMTSRMPHLRDRLNRFYNLSVYRQLSKLRR